MLNEQVPVRSGAQFLRPGWILDEFSIRVGRARR